MVEAHSMLLFPTVRATGGVLWLRHREKLENNSSRFLYFVASDGRPRKYSTHTQLLQ